MSTGPVTTTEAALLTGRTPDSVRRALGRGQLAEVGRTKLGRPLFDPQAVLNWHASVDYRPGRTRSHYKRTLACLTKLQPAMAEDLAEILQLHPGNVRKHLLALAELGKAERQADGTWVTTPADTGAA